MTHIIFKLILHYYLVVAGISVMLGPGGKGPVVTVGFFFYRWPLFKHRPFYIHSESIIFPTHLFKIAWWQVHSKFLQKITFGGGGRWRKSCNWALDSLVPPLLLLISYKLNAHIIYVNTDTLYYWIPVLTFMIISIKSIWYQ